MQGGPPDELNPRHDRAAMLLATGLFTVKDVAERLGFSYNRMCTIAGSPLFKALVKKLQERMREADIDAAVREVMEDTGENVKFLKGVRSGDEFDNPGDPRVMQSRLRASEILFDRQVPRRQQVESEQTLTVRLERATVDRLDAVMIEDGAAKIEPKSIETFEAEYDECDPTDS